MNLKPTYSTQNEIKIGSHTLGENHPVYFIADIAANHDGDLERAKSLIYLAAEAGAGAVGDECPFLLFSFCFFFLFLLLFF